MSDETLPKRFNEERDPGWNREPGIVITPGSNYQKEMEKWEQFPGKWGNSPGNAYQYRPYPKMLYRADKYNGVIVCMAAPPDPTEFANPGEFARAEERARRFTESCQKVVRDERELQAAMEQGWRESPQEAVAYIKGKDDSYSRSAAERAYQDRNMTEPAKREIEKAITDAGGDPLAEMPEQPKRRRGRPRNIDKVA